MADKFHCAKCGILIAEINKGAVRNHSVMLCSICWDKAKSAMEIADMASETFKQNPFYSKDDPVGFLKNIFHMKDKD